MHLTDCQIAQTHMNADGEAVWIDLLSGLDVDVTARGSRARVEVGVMGSQFATECYTLCQSLQAVQVSSTYHPYAEPPRGSSCNSIE